MKIALIFSVLATLAPYALGHATEIRHCITVDGFLRIFIQHWHGEQEAGASDTMVIRANHENGQRYTRIPTGNVYNVEDITTGLPGCEFTISDAVTKCDDANHNDWVWYDFHATLGVEVSYTLEAGNSAMMEEGCPELLPATISGVLQKPSQEMLMQRADALFDAQYEEVVNYWTPEVRANAKPLDMRAFIDPFHEEQQNSTRRFLYSRDLYGNNANQTFEQLTDPVANNRWTTDTMSTTGGGKMKEATGRILFRFGTGVHSCSGTAVRDYGSPDRSLVVTAAHCMYEERSKTFASYLMFIPNIDDGNDGISDRNCDDDPFGCWIPSYAVVDSEWATNLNHVSHDFAFLVVRNKGAHAGPGGRDLALEETVTPVDLDWTNKAALEKEQPVYSMGLPGSWSNQLRYARGSLKMKDDLQFVYGCQLTEGSSGGPMPIDPYDEDPMLFSISSFKSGYFDGDEFVQTACGGPYIYGNSFCKLLEVAEAESFASTDVTQYGGVIQPYENVGCTLPGSCSVDSECDDGLFCNGMETCGGDDFCLDGPGDPCQSHERCDENTKTCLPPCVSDGECSDDIFCNGVETCVAGKCVEGLGNPCGEGEMCDPMLDTCTVAQCIRSLDCDDGLFCNGKEICVEGQCFPGTTPCEGGERCDEVSQSCADEVCWLIGEQDYCQDDVTNPCCVCLSYCEPQQENVIECAPWLWYPHPDSSGLGWGGNSTYIGPTCLMFMLFAEEENPTRFRNWP